MDHFAVPEIAKAFQLSSEQFKSKYGVEKPERTNVKFIFHCLGGIRSKEAVDILHEEGYH